MSRGVLLHNNGHYYGLYFVDYIISRIFKVVVSIQHLCICIYIIILTLCH